MVFPLLFYGVKDLKQLTEKQKAICYYRIKGYSPRHCALIAQVSDSYANRVISGTTEVDLDDYTPPIECMVRKRVLDHILEGAGYVFIPKSEKYAYISLLAYLGFKHTTLRLMFPDDEPRFIYMASHRSDKAWKTFNSDVIGVNQVDYDNLMNIRKPKR